MSELEAKTNAAVLEGTSDFNEADYLNVQIPSVDERRLRHAMKIQSGEGLPATARKIYRDIKQFTVDGPLDEATITLWAYEIFKSGAKVGVLERKGFNGRSGKKPKVESPRR